MSFHLIALADFTSLNTSTPQTRSDLYLEQGKKEGTNDFKLPSYPNTLVWKHIQHIWGQLQSIRMSSNIHDSAEAQSVVQPHTAGRVLWEQSPH